MIQGGVLLSAGLAVGKRDRTEMGTRAVRILATAQSSPHAGFNPVHLLEPGFVECLRRGNLLRGGGSGRLSFGLLPPWPPPDLRLRFCPPVGEGGGAEVLSGGPVGRG